ncbi:MAG: F0F1 ATP synthase subunit gamma [Nitrococcus mobilis]|nr:F0F1 ATP synthase subunit gamma [Nitrococcus mobilis]
MTTRRELDTRLHTLGDLGEILGSLKNLALIETRKLVRLQGYQTEMAATISRAAEDFRRYYGDMLLPAGSSPLVLAVGSERGFVGDFNERIIAALSPNAAVLAVGQRLCRRMEGDPRLADALDGPLVAEEVEPVLSALVKSLSRLSEHGGPPRLEAIHHTPGETELQHIPLLPPYRETIPPSPDGNPPRLNLKPRVFLGELLEHSLFASLRAVFLSSLMAENERRSQHLEGAARRLEEQKAALALRRKTLRQEEITEEIEMILLSETTTGTHAES